jgi:hypothetical protein
MDTELNEVFEPVTFELLNYNKVLSDFYLDTPQGQIREFVNRSPNIPTRQTVFENGKPIVYIHSKLF